MTKNVSQKFKPTDKFTFKISNINSGGLANSCKMKNTVLNIIHHSLDGESHSYQNSDNFIFGEDSNGNYLPQAKTVTSLKDFNFSCQLLQKKKHFVTQIILISLYRFSWLVLF
jgi:hypothetical protein